MHVQPKFVQLESKYSKGLSMLGSKLHTETVHILLHTSLTPNPIHQLHFPYSKINSQFPDKPTAHVFSCFSEFVMVSLCSPLSGPRKTRASKKKNTLTEAMGGLRPGDFGIRTDEEGAFHSYGVPHSWMGYKGTYH